MMMAGPPLLLHGAPLDTARAQCIFLHGRSQTPEEMVDQNLSRLVTPDVAYLLPRAPGKSWYAARAVDPLTPTTQTELAASMSLIVQTAAAGRPGLPLLLAGFSQGACLALELVLRGQVMPQALVALTGCRVGTPTCDRPTEALNGLPIYLSGSDADPWIPPAAFADAAGSLSAQGATLRAESHPGRPHAVSAAEIAVLDAMLAALIPPVPE
jgi:phospholipase/carboxylesterase